MFNRFVSPLVRNSKSVRVYRPWTSHQQQQAKRISTTVPSMIRIRKSSDVPPDAKPAPEVKEKTESETEQQKGDQTQKPVSSAEPSVKEESVDSASSVKESQEKPETEATENTDTESAAAGASKKKINASPFGFSSAGSGMASNILGSATGEEVSGNRDGLDGSGKEGPREGMSAAEARRARRQRADLPPLEDEPQVKAAKYVGSGLIFGLIIGAAGYYGRPYTEKEIEEGCKDDPTQSALTQIWYRVMKRGVSSFSFLSEPVTEKLLPDPNEYTMPYTLVLNLDDMLIHMDWTKEHGWRIAKRPGLDHFLAYMASMYEVVIFSTQPSHSGMTVMERLDPLEYAPFRLYRDHMRNVDGKNYKDLTTINRDMSRVIMVDIDPAAFEYQPDNGVLARPFTGQPGDNWIEQMTEFLEYIHMTEPKDVRPWIKIYKGRDVAKEFVKWEDSIRKQLVDEWEVQRKNSGSWKSLILGGGPADAEHPPVPEFDKMRKLMRENFEIQHKEILAMIEKERIKNEEEMQKQMKDMTIWKMMTQSVSPQSPGSAEPQSAQK